MTPESASVISLEVDGRVVELSAEGTLLDALRATLGVTTVKDGCSPQGQCGCCTVLVDGVARVACVTPVRRLAGRSVTTTEAIDPVVLDRLIAAFEATGASQCGFCTPGILSRFAGLSRKGTPTETQVRTALGAHLCRCTGNQPIVEAALMALDPTAAIPEVRDPLAASERASLESGVPQKAGPTVVLGGADFAADSAPEGARVAIATSDGGYVVGNSVAEARAASAKIQGRNSTAPLRLPLEIPEVDGAALRLATTFVEPGYVEPDTSWCEPGGVPASPFANAGAFGAKRHSKVADDAQRLANELGEAVLVQWPREEVVRRGAKRPPLALALRHDGTGICRIATTPRSESLSELVLEASHLFPGLDFEIIEVPGPPVGSTHRGALIAELLAAQAVLGAQGIPRVSVEAPNRARATVGIEPDGSISVQVAAGDPLCPITLRSFAIGAVHQALGMVRSEGLSVDSSGVVHDLTIRSFGILSATQTPKISVEIIDDSRPAVAAGVAVMAAAMAASWIDAGTPSAWPTTREVVS